MGVSRPQEMTLCKQKDYLRPILSLCALRGLCGKPELGIPALALLLERAVRGSICLVSGLYLEHQFSAFLMPPPLNTASRVVVIPYPTIVIFLVHMCDFAAVMSRNINTDPQ